MLVLKWLKINCLMLYSQKNKCLVLSKYPHSDPLNTYANSVVESSFALMKLMEVLMNVYLPHSFNCCRK